MPSCCGYSASWPRWSRSSAGSGRCSPARLPDFAADYLTGYVRWQTRYNAYYLLLTDQYPPFTLEDAITRCAC